MHAVYEMSGLLAYLGEGWGTAWTPGGGGWWWLAGPLWMVLWVALIAGVVWLAARGIGARDRSGVDRARDILAERYARGELSPEEYRQRLDQLRS